MNKDINKTLQAIVPVLNMNHEKVKTIEAVHNYYQFNGETYCKEVAEITYEDGYHVYADIGSDSNLAAVYDVIAVIQGLKTISTAIDKIERGVYEPG